MIRFPLLLLAIVALLFAIWAGLLRMGWVWPPVQPDLAAAHGPLMVSAFLGTVIGLERAVALNKRWAYLVPLLSALGGLLLIVGLSWTWAGRLLGLASLGLVVLFVLIVRQHATIYTWTMAAGSVAWLAGNILGLMGRPLYAVAPWWVAFLVLTIAGERLELSRVLRHSRRTIALFTLGVALFLAGIIGSLVSYDLGVRLTGLGMLALAAWLVVYDIARRNLRRDGLTRFIAWCLFSGYFWLAAGGALWLVYGGVMAGPIYDAILHSVFLGFVFAMIFGHAPLIFPSILGRPMAYLPAFYLPLVALHLSLALRVISDLFNFVTLRQWGGLLNGVTLLLFLGITALGLARGAADRRRMLEKN
ncbi:conserved membrane protein of unknown function [Candidatus Promineifilum breve]|uniref:NnrS family protein n=1 Tax=Candidatus Promineifilum breve TaxID=1806508 RepID=A0A160SZY3_9CHLR|nr:hypothetical protein [Candidatus Promineifilum breve]CUS01978.2 conserved membrane protein of unknown function [Candidatus Promineifilum breve]